MTNTPSNNDATARQADQQSKKKGKEYADAQQHAKGKNIQQGDYVLIQQKVKKEKNIQSGDYVQVQQKYQNKFSTTMIKVNGSEIMIIWTNAS